MMIDTPVVDPVPSEDASEGDKKEPPPEPAAPPKPKKTWAMPKAPPPGSDDKAPKKKSLMEIMQEEKKNEEDTQVTKQKELELRLQQQEEAALMRAMQASMASSEQPETNNENDTMDEDLKLALMLSMQDQPQSNPSIVPAVAAAPMAAAAAAAPSEDENGLTEEEMREIEKALQEADAAENAKTDTASLKLALELQNEEAGKVQVQKRVVQGNVRTMNRADFLREKGQSDDYDMDYYEEEDYTDQYDDLEETGATEAGYRINSTKKSPWSRTDHATIRGPNDELRTKHDPRLQGQANAYRLELRADDTTSGVSNRAYNAFRNKMQKKTVKGVAAHGHGRATADTDKTRDGALDGRVRLQIARAVNNGLIEAFHGCVKEGKEAEVFHAAQGANSEGFDVAVKVFKRISEFRNRGQYVGGDPRYGDGQDFRHAGARKQVEMWAEKEHRNLIRAYRAKVPVPKPLWQKENVLFIRFLGEEGWPSPQLRELDIKKGSKKWTALYEQTMTAMQLLYCDAKLVHGDLSEYNILVCPERFLERFDDADDVEEGEQEGDDEKKQAAETNSADWKMPASVETLDEEAKSSATESDDSKKPASDKLHDEEKKPTATGTAKEEAKGDSLQIVLIDFGQAVDLRHPDVDELLKRDVTRVKQFYDKMGITPVGVEAAMAYVQTKGASLR